MKNTFLIVSFFCLSMNKIHPEPTQPTSTSTMLSTLSTIEERYELIQCSNQPRFITHGKTIPFLGHVFNFYNSCIFFDKDISGNPIYKSISEHATDNPNFGKILLVLYYPKKKYKDQFVILGTYSNPIARKQLIQKMKTFFGYIKQQAILFPKQNVIIVGANAPERCSEQQLKKWLLEIGEEFEKWLKNQQVSKKNL